MNKLKTLKDFEFIRLGTNYIPNSEELRQGATKHIEKLQRRIDELYRLSYYVDGPTANKYKKWIYQNQSVINWIKEFFNIKKEGDIKCVGY